MNPTQTPREARLFINQAEVWYRRNTGRFSGIDQIALHGMFEYAHTPAHARDLRDELARRVKKGRDADPSRHHSPEHSPAPSPSVLPTP